MKPKIEKKKTTKNKARNWKSKNQSKMETENTRIKI